MQSQKLPLWQLFYSPAQNNGISHRPAPDIAHTYAPAYTAHGAHPQEQRPRRPARHGIQTIGIPAQGSRHKAHVTHAAPGSRIRLVRQSRPHRCGRLPFFSAGASPRGTTLPEDPPDPPAASLLPGKPGSVPGITPFLESLGP